MSRAHEDGPSSSKPLATHQQYNSPNPRIEVVVKLASAMSVAGFYFALATGHVPLRYLLPTTIFLAFGLFVYLLRVDSVSVSETTSRRHRHLAWRGTAAGAVLLAGLGTFAVRQGREGPPETASGGAPLTDGQAVGVTALLRGNFLVERGTVNGAQLEESPTLVISGSGCPNKQASLTFQLDDRYERVSLRAGVDDVSPGSTHIRIDLLDGSTSLAQDVLSSGPGASLSSSTVGVQVLTLRATALTHATRGCSPPDLKVHVFDVTLTRRPVNEGRQP